MNSKSVNQAMQAYRLAFTTVTNLQTKHDALVEEQSGLLTAITQAQAVANKAREVLLNVRIKEFKEFKEFNRAALQRVEQHGAAVKDVIKDIQS